MFEVGTSAPSDVYSSPYGAQRSYKTLLRILVAELLEEALFQAPSPIPAKRRRVLSKVYLFQLWDGAGCIMGQRVSLSSPLRGRLPFMLCSALSPWSTWQDRGLSAPM